jgi:hypothetical protein
MDKQKPAAAKPKAAGEESKTTDEKSK